MLRPSTWFIIVSMFSWVIDWLEGEVNYLSLNMLFSFRFLTVILRIIWSLLLPLAVSMHEVFWMGYTKRAWDPRSLQSILDCLVYYIMLVRSLSISNIFMTISVQHLLIAFRTTRGGSRWAMLCRDAAATRCVVLHRGRDTHLLREGRHQDTGVLPVIQVGCFKSQDTVCCYALCVVV